MPITKIKGMKKVQYGQGSLKPKYFYREKPFNKKIKRSITPIHSFLNDDFTTKYLRKFN